MSVLEKVRRWIDGDIAESVLEAAARDAQVKPRSKAEAFIVKIARAVEQVMQDEMVPLPQGTTIIPTEYIIFLSESDDKDWQGIKRRGLEQGLYHILAERAREISGKKKLETKSFVIELRVDGTLETGDVRVQHGWEDSSSGKTGVLSRPKAERSESSASAALSEVANTAYSPPPPDFAARSTSGFTAPPTIPQASISQVIPMSQDESDVLTNVRKRSTELYRLEIWLNGVRQSVVPIFNKEISIGRGSKTRPVDVTLSGDAEISRRHATIGTDGAGNFWVVNEGRNPAAIRNGLMMFCVQ
ncbi:MAG: FHA domain-containing protein [Acidobacteria bacterium]|nr:FHA domain-containing protein [Acidobacteriota bacterium]